MGNDSIRVLVVDDDKNFLTIIQTYLSILNIKRVATATSYQEGLRLAIHLILRNIFLLRLIDNQSVVEGIV